MYPPCARRTLYDHTRFAMLRRRLHPMLLFAVQDGRTGHRQDPHRSNAGACGLAQPTGWRGGDNGSHVRQSRLFDFSPELPVNQGDACCAIVNIAQDDVGKKKVNELGALCWGSAVLALSGKLL